MLRYMIFSLSNLLIILGCEEGVTYRPGDDVTNTQIQITDTTGLPRAVFRPAEEFIVSWHIRNPTMRPLTCEYTGPPVRFNLTQGDSVISESVEGWALVVISDTIAPRDSIGWRWRAPSGYAHDPVVILKPGRYEVNATSWPHFDSLQVSLPKSRDILIVSR